jgi:hypothetical protein
MSLPSGINLQQFFGYTGQNSSPTEILQSETDHTEYIMSESSFPDQIDGKKFNFIQNPTSEENDILLKKMLDMQTDAGKTDQKETNDSIVDIVSFSEIISNNIDKEEFKNFIDIQSIYASSLGGCNCNRKSREENAQNYFKMKITNATLEDFQKIKTLLNFTKISFKDNNGQIFLEV